jgi:transcriptional regulator with XRE-family HTH domain
MSWKGMRRQKPDDLRYEILIRTLRSIRMELRISQARLSDKAGFHKDMVVYWEGMQVVPSTVNLIRWAHVLGYELVLRPRVARVVPDTPFKRTSKAPIGFVRPSKPSRGDGNDEGDGVDWE